MISGLRKKNTSEILGLLFMACEPRWRRAHSGEPVVAGAGEERAGEVGRRRIRSLLDRIWPEEGGEAEAAAGDWSDGGVEDRSGGRVGDRGSDGGVEDLKWRSCGERLEKRGGREGDWNDAQERSGRRSCCGTCGAVFFFDEGQAGLVVNGLWLVSVKHGGIMDH